MSKFTIKVELQGLKIEVEGTREDVPRLAQKVGEQIGTLVQPALLIEGNGNGTPNYDDDHPASPDRARTRRRRSTGIGSGTRATEHITLSVSPSQHGSPRQSWNTVQKSLWVLSVAGKPLAAYSIEKLFNEHFKAAGPIRRGNISRDLEKEKLRGKEAPVGSDVTDGSTRYFLTDAGTALVKRLITEGDRANAATAS